MSERLTHVAYGDVLSSIRRLVTDETAPAVGDARAGSGPLVLTPALRVADAGPVAPFVEIASDGDSKGWPRIVAASRTETPADGIPRVGVGACNVDRSTEALMADARLREVVRELIHEELRGVTGERMTRNLRKLIRAEIHRALLTCDPD